MVTNTILTKKAIQIINKKLQNKKLSQQDSNYLSRFIRPKLRDMVNINAEELLKKLEYNPKSRSIEGKIRKIILENVKDVDSIILCGSAIQTNYSEYNDIDVIAATKRIMKLGAKEKYELIRNIKKIGKKQNLNLDIQIYSKKSILEQYPGNPSLIYQFKDSKVIYGDIKLPEKIQLSSLALRMKLDWSEDFDIKSEAREIYYALRNAALVFLLMNKKIDNFLLKENLNNTLGGELIKNLRNNTATKKEKKLALAYLNSLINYLDEELKKPKWEKIEI